jgi:NAD(P)H-hydrate epimerase
MRYALTVEQMRAAEERAVADGSATVEGLMARAGEALAHEVMRRVPEGPVVVICGPGNNGGDGWVAARRLTVRGRRVTVITTRTPAGLSGAAAAAARDAFRSGVPWREWDEEPGTAALLDGAAVIVDALFGFGFTLPLRAESVALIRALRDAGAPVIAADLPSGIETDTGRAADEAVRATATVTFSALKPGLLIHPGAVYAGEIVVADLGVPESLLRPEGALEVPEPADLQDIMPWPLPGDHKGSRGRVAVVAGSASYSGAAVLAVGGALRMGPGYVYAVVPEPVAPVVRAVYPSAIVRVARANPAGAFADAGEVLDLTADADAVVAGPGMTTDAGAAACVRALLESRTCPLVLDADGLNAVAHEPDLFTGRSAPLVITPHPGEMARLLGTEARTVQDDRLAAVRRLAGPARACLLKGPHSLVASATRVAMVLAGNAGLARAGSGDVLSGMIGTLLAQGLGPFEAALLGAHLHGRAADHAARSLTEVCVAPTDLVAFLPDAVRELAGG